MNNIRHSSLLSANISQQNSFPYLSFSVPKIDAKYSAIIQASMLEICYFSVNLLKTVVIIGTHTHNSETSYAAR